MEAAELSKPSVVLIWITSNTSSQNRLYLFRWDDNWNRYFWSLLNNKNRYNPRTVPFNFCTICSLEMSTVKTLNSHKTPGKQAIVENKNWWTGKIFDFVVVAVVFNQHIKWEEINAKQRPTGVWECFCFLRKHTQSERSQGSLSVLSLLVLINI